MCWYEAFLLVVCASGVQGFPVEAKRGLRVRNANRNSGASFEHVGELYRLLLCCATKNKCKRVQSVVC